MGVQNTLGYLVGVYNIFGGTKYSVTPVNLCTNLCYQRAGLGLRKSIVFYMDMPVL